MVDLQTCRAEWGPSPEPSLYLNYCPSTLERFVVSKRAVENSAGGNKRQNNSLMFSSRLSCYDQEMVAGYVDLLTLINVEQRCPGFGNTLASCLSSNPGLLLCSIAAVILLAGRATQAVS